jgi:hypothetical protein
MGPSNYDPEDKLGALKKSITVGAGLVAGAIAIHGLARHRGRAQQELIKKLRTKLTKANESKLQRAAKKGTLTPTVVGGHQDLRVSEHHYEVKKGQYAGKSKGMPLYRSGKREAHAYTKPGEDLSRSGNQGFQKVVTIPRKGAVDKRLGEDIQTAFPNKPGYIKPEEQWPNYRVQKAVRSQRSAVADPVYKDATGRLKPEAAQAISERRAALVEKNRPFAREQHIKVQEQIRKAKIKKNYPTQKDDVTLERVLKVIREFQVTTSANRGGSGKFTPANGKPEGPSPEHMQQAYHVPFIKKAAMTAGLAAGAYLASKPIRKAIGKQWSNIQQSGEMKDLQKDVARRFVNAVGQKNSAYFRRKVVEKATKKTAGYGDPSKAEHYINSAVRQKANEHSEAVINRYQRMKTTSEALKTVQAKKERMGDPFTNATRRAVGNNVRKMYGEEPISGRNKAVAASVAAVGAGVAVSSSGRKSNGPEIRESIPLTPEGRVAHAEVARIRNETDMQLRQAEVAKKKAIEGQRQMRNDRMATGLKNERLVDQIGVEKALRQTAEGVATGKIPLGGKTPMILGPDGTIANERLRTKAAQMKVGRLGFVRPPSTGSIPTHEEAARLAAEENQQKAARGGVFTPVTPDRIRARAVGGDDKLPSPAKMDAAAKKKLAQQARLTQRAANKITKAREKVAKRKERERKKGLHKTMDGTGNETYLPPGHASSGHNW